MQPKQICQEDTQLAFLLIIQESSSKLNPQHCSYSCLSSIAKSAINSRVCSCGASEGEETNEFVFMETKIEQRRLYYVICKDASELASWTRISEAPTHPDDPLQGNNKYLRADKKEDGRDLTENLPGQIPTHGKHLGNNETS